MTMTEIGKDFVDHSGVKGMKWGVRRSPKELAKGDSEKGGKEEPKAAPKAKGKKVGEPVNSRTPGKSVKDMSDKELKDYVNRLNMEQQYARMQPTPMSKKAIKFVTDIAVGAVKQQLTNELSSQIGKQLGAAKTRRSGIPKPPDIRPRLVAPPTGEKFG